MDGPKVAAGDEEATTMADTEAAAEAAVSRRKCDITLVFAFNFQFFHFFKEKKAKEKYNKKVHEFGKVKKKISTKSASIVVNSQ